MKKVILFTVTLVTMCLTSCNHTPADVIRADFMYAFSDYECRESQVNCECIQKVYDTKGGYRPNAKELSDSLTLIMEKAASECFDSLYIKYGDKLVAKMVYRSKGVVLENKEMLHKYYVNSSVAKIMNNVALQVKTQSILNPSEEDKLEAIREAFGEGGYDYYRD
jgi:hypothetical protein